GLCCFRCGGGCGGCGAQGLEEAGVFGGVAGFGEILDGPRDDVLVADGGGLPGRGIGDGQRGGDEAVEDAVVLVEQVDARLAEGAAGVGGAGGEEGVQRLLGTEVGGEANTERDV